jgi:hypothetical protein
MTPWTRTSAAPFRRRIRRSTRSQAVDKVRINFYGDDLKLRIAKTIAVLQILGNMPVTVRNVASLMHPAIDSPSLEQQVSDAVDAMLKHSQVPLGEQSGNLRFFSEKLNDIERERAGLAPRTADRNRIFNEALHSVFDPPPSARVANTLTVTSGIRHLTGGRALALSGEREVVQTVVVFADTANYDTERTRLIDESRHRSSENTVYLLGRAAPEAEDLTVEIRRCQGIVQSAPERPGPGGAGLLRRPERAGGQADV